jgi:hypothetical protein
MKQPEDIKLSGIIAHNDQFSRDAMRYNRSYQRRLSNNLPVMFGKHTDFCQMFLKNNFCLSLPPKTGQVFKVYSDE